MYYWIKSTQLDTSVTYMAVLQRPNGFDILKVPLQTATTLSNFGYNVCASSLLFLSLNLVFVGLRRQHRSAIVFRSNTPVQVHPTVSWTHCMWRLHIFIYVENKHCA